MGKISPTITLIMMQKLVASKSRFLGATCMDSKIEANALTVTFFPGAAIMESSQNGP